MSVDNISNSQSTTLSEAEARKLLTKFQFPSKRWYDKVASLSGGERRRLQLLQVLAKGPNVLLLDEPSNDLDLATLQALEEYLIDWKGCLVIVSHDNYLVNRVAEHLFLFEGDGIVRDFNGSYDDYLDYRAQKEKQLKSEAKSADKVSLTVEEKSVESLDDESPEAKKTRQNAPRNLKRVEAQITKLDEKLKKLDQNMLENGRDLDVLKELQRERDQTESKSNKLIKEMEVLLEIVG